MLSCKLLLGILYTSRLIQKEGDTKLTLPSSTRQSLECENTRPLKVRNMFSYVLTHVRAQVSRKADHMQTLWGERAPRPRRRKRKAVPRITAGQPYSITGANDCQIIGHTLNHYDLSGCTTCLDCGVHVFCPGCIAQHPHDSQAVPVVCERHEESAVSA